MKVKTALVRNGHHMRPLLAVLKRYGIGTADKYGRGMWISENDLDKIEGSMKADPSAFEFGGRILVNGTNMHNQVEIADFRGLL